MAVFSGAVCWFLRIGRYAKLVGRRFVVCAISMWYGRELAVGRAVGVGVLAGCADRGGRELLGSVIVSGRSPGSPS